MVGPSPAPGMGGAARVLVTMAALVACLGAIQCGGGNATTGPTPPPGSTPPGDPTPIPPTTPPPSGPQVFVGAGDIAQCDALEPARQTAALLRGIGGTVFTLGDNAYVGGTPREYQECYEPTWGSEKFRTRPTLGNHEYEGGNGGAPYFSYFGSNAGTPGLGYYSHEVGAWHAIALNSNIGTSENSPQGVWLRNDLANSRARCTVAYFHHPLYTSGQNGPQNISRDLWRMLYTAGADLVLSGHDHLYERFAPQDADGRLDLSRGMREFVVGTGGASLYVFNPTAANSEIRVRAFGVLKLTLDNDAYDWQFIQVGGSVTDSGRGSCH